MTDVDQSSLIPGEELTLLKIAVDEALELAARRQREVGRQKLRHGMRESRAWKEEVWGDALTRWWIWALRQYDARTR